MNQITREDLVRAAGRADFDEDDIENWLATANADSHETAAWLPYYKLALAMLGSACAQFHAVAESLETCGHNPSARPMIDAALDIVLAAMLVQGVGPDASPGLAAEAGEMVAGLAGHIRRTNEAMRAEAAARAS